MTRELTKAEINRISNNPIDGIVATCRFCGEKDLWHNFIKVSTDLKTGICSKCHHIGGW